VPAAVIVAPSATRLNCRVKAKAACPAEFIASDGRPGALPMKPVKVCLRSQVELPAGFLE